MKFISILLSTTIVAITIQKCRARYLLVETSDVTDNEASNRIPSSCDLITKDLLITADHKRSCSILFQEFDKLIDRIALNTTVDTKFKKGYKQYMKSNFCGKHWSKMIKIDDWKIITCKADTPGNVKQSCPDICNRAKTDESDISEEGSDEDSSEESSEEDSSEESDEESKEKERCTPAGGPC